MPKKSKMMKVSKDKNKEQNIALYCRVSTRRQAEEGYSIEIQKERLSAYVIAKYGNGSKYEFYIDDGYSGGSLERPEIQRLISNVENHTITDVIVMKLDRLSRSQKDTLYLIEDIFLANNVAFSSIQESFDTSTAQGRVVVGILSVFAQFERENIYERTRAGMKKRVEDGYWPGGGGTPFGYDYDPNAGILIPNKDAEIVKQVYKMYLGGAGPQTIANTLGLKYDKLVYQILTRKTYTGKMFYNGIEYQMRHKPIISEEVFNETQTLIHSRKTVRTSSKPNYLLSGLCVCGRCGAKMRYQKWGKAGAKIICYSRQKSKPYLVKDAECDNALHWATDIEDAVVEDMFTYGQDVEVKPLTDTTGNSVIDTLMMRRKTLESKIRRIIKLFAVADENTEQELQCQIQEFQVQIKRIDEKIEKEKNRQENVEQLDTIKERLKSIKTMWPLMDDYDKQTFIREIIEKVTIDGSAIQIDYKF